MRHRKKGKQLGKTRKEKRAILKSLASSLIKHGRIKTTLTKAQALQPYIEKKVSRAKKEGLQTKRLLRKYFSLEDVNTLINSWAPLFKDIKGGYTRIIKISNRVSDASPMAYVEFTKKPKVVKEKKAKDKKVKKEDKKNKK